MELIKTIGQVRDTVKDWKKRGFSIGLVPTMGYLHEGHESLIKKAVEQNDKVVVSDFVNPMQFGENEDLDSYPRDIKRDCDICRNMGVDIVFNPDTSEMYGEYFSSYVNMNTLPDGLCGKSRPIHFKGVCTVVAKLFNIVCPDRAYFGQKDAQQLAIIKRMVSDLNFDVQIVGCPIIREEDGLAKSSRNTYLSPEERKAAVVLSRALNIGKNAVENGERNAGKVISLIKEEINREKLARIDYVEIVDINLLQPVSEINCSILAAVAVYIGKTRLIDNFIISLRGD